MGSNFKTCHNPGQNLTSDVTAGVLSLTVDGNHLLWHHLIALWLVLWHFLGSFHPRRAAVFYWVIHWFILFWKHDKWVYRGCDMNYPSSQMNNGIWMNVCNFFPWHKIRYQGPTTFSHCLTLFMSFYKHTVFLNVPGTLYLFASLETLHYAWYEHKIQWTVTGKSMWSIVTFVTLPYFLHYFVINCGLIFNKSQVQTNTTCCPRSWYFQRPCFSPGGGKVLYACPSYFIAASTDTSWVLIGNWLIQRLPSPPSSNTHR